MAEENENTESTQQQAEESAEPEAEESTEPAVEETEADEEPTAAAGEGDEAEGADHPAGAESGASEAQDQSDEAERAGDEQPAGDDALSPKQRRKLERSRSGGPPGPQRSPEERAAARRERRLGAAQRRGRHRRRLRERRGEPRRGTPAAERVPGKRKVRLGTVVSSGASKTITVRIERARRDAAYEKVVRRSSTVHAHDERNEANEGDVVRVVETRPRSRTKRWRLLEIVERAR
jgi:small subunit ribosomal protein S17